MGANGQVGWELERSLQPVGEVVALTRESLDLNDPGAVARAMREIRPQIVCNAAGYTSVEHAETEPDLAFRVNAEAVGELGTACKQIRAAVIHFSTDYVFDGELDRAYREDDHPKPVNTYGSSKRAGEEALAASGAAHLIARTSWVYSTRRTNFVRTILRLAREREELSVVDDQVGTPTWARWLAEAVSTIVAAAIQGTTRSEHSDLSTWFSQHGGILHLTGEGQTTWYEFARAILELDPKREEQRAKGLIPVSTSSYPSMVRRPLRTVLESSRIHEHSYIVRPHWKEQLRLALATSLRRDVSLVKAHFTFSQRINRDRLDIL